jgi:putative transcriptional regulator
MLLVHEKKGIARVSTVQKWEIGEKKPSGPSLKLLSLIDRKGLEAVL